MALVTLYLVLSMFIAEQPDLKMVTIECHNIECVQSVISLSQSSDVFRLRVLDVNPRYVGMSMIDPPIADFRLN